MEHSPPLVMFNKIMLFNDLHSHGELLSYINDGTSCLLKRLAAVYKPNADEV